MYNLFNRKIPVLLIGILTLVFFAACEKEVTKEVPVYPVIQVQVVSGSTSTIDSVSQGSNLVLTATVTTESAGPFTYRWYASGGEFHESDADTVTWKAPDEDGPYTVGVTVTDGQSAGVGTANIGVGMYAPTVSPYFVGNEACSGCHAASGIYAGWESTGHADAWATLQESGHPASYCEPCHSVQDTIFGNSGYDEAAIAKFENVQCENCHGPASNHTASMNAADITIDYTADNCGKCHEGSHHPYLSEWEQSVHAAAPESHGAESSSCQGCHEGVAAVIRLNGDLSSWYGSGAVARPDTSEYPIAAITCQVCHSAHDATNPGQIRTVADVQLGPSNGTDPIITDGGVGKLCMQCHHARHTGDEHVPNGDNRFGPHHSPQADLAAGATGYHGVAPANFVWAQPSHLNVQNSCKTCHINMAEFNGTTAVTGHSFEPTVEACENCHGVISSFDEIMALDDFDGDGSVEGLQDEVAGLIHAVDKELYNVSSAVLLAAGVDTTDFYGDIFDKDMVYYAYNGTVVVDSVVVPMEWRAVGWNMVFVEDDGSHGIHNPDYAVQLLQQSYQYLTGTDLPNAFILREEGAVAAQW